MHLGQQYCRSHLTEADRAFVGEVLSDQIDPQDEAIWQDEAQRDALLDDDLLFQEVLDCREILPVSLELYFYVLLRHVLRSTPLDERCVADYLACSLTRALKSERKLPPLYVIDVLHKLDGLNDSQQFYERVQLADDSLILTGIFPEHIQFRTQRRGAPSLHYYEGVGRMQYQCAGEHRLAQEHELGPIFICLSEEFSHARKALNQLSDQLVSLGEIPIDFDKLL
tara:strand:+ start:27734 stop:28408 length:675 start_codon:yes stop_codon:yes gene_type:complete